MEEKDALFERLDLKHATPQEMQAHFMKSYAEKLDEIKELDTALSAKQNRIDVANRNIGELNDRDKVLCAKVASTEKLNSGLALHLDGARASEEEWRRNARRAGEQQLRAENVVDELTAENGTLASIIESNRKEILDYREALKKKRDIIERKDAEIHTLTKRDEESGTVFIQGDLEQAVAQSPTIVHKWESGDSPVAVKLIKNTKGYGWEISIKARDPESLMEELHKVEDSVKAEYGAASE